VVAAGFTPARPWGMVSAQRHVTGMAVRNKLPSIETVGSWLVETFHTLFLFLIGVGIAWAALDEVMLVIHQGHPTLKDILLMFIFLELLAMVGIYFKTHVLPVRFLLYVAITAVTRFLVIDIKNMDAWLIVALCTAILILTASIFVLRYNSAQFGAEHQEE
jgi:phosphate starvation-inducible membrane PsiE